MDLAVDLVTCCLLQNFIHKEEEIIHNLSGNPYTSDSNSDQCDISRSHSVRGNLAANLICNKQVFYDTRREMTMT